MDCYGGDRVAGAICDFPGKTRSRWYGSYSGIVSSTPSRNPHSGSTIFKLAVWLLFKMHVVTDFATISVSVLFGGMFRFHWVQRTVTDFALARGIG